MQETPLPLQALLLLTLIMLLLHLASTTTSGSSKQAKAKAKRRLPPSPPALPVIGHLHLVGDSPHVSLCGLSRTHGHDDGLMLLHLGSVPTLVVSSPRAAQAIMRTNDHLFGSRPPSSIADALLYGPSSDIAFSPYGEHWRQARKLVTTHLFTVKKVQSFRIARQQEVEVVISRIREAAAASAAVDLGEVVNTYANDVVCRAVSGKLFRAEGRNKTFRELIEANAALIGGFNMEDYFPRLAKVLRLFNRFVRNNNADTAHKRWDELLETIIKDHEKNLMHHDGVDERRESDFIDVLLSVHQEFHGITRDHIKAILMDLFGAGTDTSSLVLEFAMAELMRKPDQLMAKLQAEVRHGTPNGQKYVEEHNLAGMTYLKAVVKETLRLHPPAPLLLPHLAMADCDIDGYTIPSGTRVIINSWAISRDPGSWEKPDDFMPERFVEGGTAAAVDLTGKDFQFVPFGAGRRICPGLNFGLATVEIMLANLAYCFDWELPIGMERDDIDMTEVFGLTVRRKEKLILVAKTDVVA